MKKVLFFIGFIAMTLSLEHGFAQTTYTKISSTSNLEVGANYLIVAHHDDYGVLAMGYQKSNNRHAVVVTENGNAITLTPSIDPNSETDVFQFTLGGNNNAWTLFDAAYGGYLYAASSSGNYLKTQSQLDNNGRWSITFNEDGTAEVIAQGENTRNNLRFNPNTQNNSPMFSCYVNSSNIDTRVSFYKEEEMVPRLHDAAALYGKEAWFIPCTARKISCVNLETFEMEYYDIRYNNSKEYSTNGSLTCGSIWGMVLQFSALKSLASFGLVFFRSFLLRRLLSG